MTHHLLFLSSNFIVLLLVSGTPPTRISTHQLTSQCRTDKAHPADTIHTNQLGDMISYFVHEHWGGWLAALFLKPHQKICVLSAQIRGWAAVPFCFFFSHNATLREQILFSVSWLSLRVGSQVMLVIVVMSHSCCSAGTYRTRTLRQMQSLFSCQHYSRYLFRKTICESDIHGL